MVYETEMTNVELVDVYGADCSEYLVAALRDDNFKRVQKELKITSKLIKNENRSEVEEYVLETRICSILSYYDTRDILGGLIERACVMDKLIFNPLTDCIVEGIINDLYSAHNQSLLDYLIKYKYYVSPKKILKESIKIRKKRLVAEYNLFNPKIINII